MTRLRIFLRANASSSKSSAVFGALIFIGPDPVAMASLPSEGIQRWRSLPTVLSKADPRKPSARTLRLFSHINKNKVADISVLLQLRRPLLQTVASMIPNHDNPS
jgi:hypothetical protein